MGKTVELVSLTFKTNDGQEITVNIESHGATGTKVQTSAEDLDSVAKFMAGIIAGIGCNQVRKIFSAWGLPFY